jgi:hypothetical protein
MIQLMGIILHLIYSFHYPNGSLECGVHLFFFYAQISEKCVHHIQVNMVLSVPVLLWVNVCGRKEKVLCDCWAQWETGKSLFLWER